MADQHSSLTRDRWSAFSLDQQILMIANEMNRASKLFGHADHGRLRSGYERVLQLVDLTVATRTRRPLRRELLRWRDLIAELYVSDPPSAEGHTAAFLVLLRFTPAAAQQIPYVALPSTTA